MQSSSNSTVNNDFTVGERQVNQDKFELYLRANKTINIRYQSMRKGSAHEWRTINVASYDNTYIRTISDNGVPYKYRRDRVVEFK